MSKRPMLPILLTAAVAMVGHVPLVSAQNPNSESDTGARIAAPTSVISGEAGPARPKVEMDAEYALGLGGHDVRVFFQEGKTFTDLDAHVFYSPLIYLRTKEDSDELDHEISPNADGVDLILKYSVETNKDLIRSTLRDKLLSEARRVDPSLESMKNKESAYRLKPLSIHSWFESYRPRGADLVVYKSRLVSEPRRLKTFNEEGKHNIYFNFQTEGEARDFVDELNAGQDNLRFVYKFDGVSYETCEAVFTGFQSQSGVRSQDGGGEAGEAQEEGAADYVTRNRVAEIAEKAIDDGGYRTQCASPRWSRYLYNQLISRLGDYQTRTLEKGWESLEKLNLFDKDDFRADFETEAKNIEKESVRDQVQEAYSEAFGESESAEGGGGLAVGWADFSIGATGRGGSAEAESSSEARTEVEVHMRKYGILGSWEGGKFTPKTIEVYTNERLNQVWGKTISIEFQFPSEGESENIVDLLLPESKYVRYAPGVIDEIHDDIGDLQMQIAALSARAGEFSTRSHSHSYASSGHAHHGLIFSQVYRFDMNKDGPYYVSQYHTSVKTSAYPSAAVANWFAWSPDYCRDESILSPRVVQFEDQWTIIFDDSSMSCTYLEVHVLYFRAGVVTGSSLDRRATHDHGGRLRLR